MSIRMVLVAWICLAVLACNSLIFAQGPTDPAGDQTELTETTIYVPFSELREVFEKEGRGVFLPYTQFQKLWEAARKSEIDSALQTTPSKPPVDTIISDISSEATVRKDVMHVDATLVIELLRRGWNTVPLQLADAAIQSATIDDQPARIVSAPNGGYQLVVENAADQPKTITLKLSYVRAYVKSPGENSVSFSAPRSAVNRWRIRVPGAGVQVSVTPMIAASQQDTKTAQDSANDPTDVVQETDLETELLAFVGSAGQVAIRWTAAREGASGMTALVSVQAAQEVFVTESAIRTRANLQYSISRATVGRLVVEVPLAEKVVNVFDPNIRKWDVEVDGDLQRIGVELFEAADSNQGLTIELERFLDEAAMQEVHVPMIRAVDVARQQGDVALRIVPDLRSETIVKAGLLQIDSTELAESMAGQAWDIAYRYAATPYDLRLKIEKIQPRIDIQQLVESYLEPDHLTIETTIIYDVQQSGIFQLELSLPAEFEIIQVRGNDVADAAAANIDSYRIEGDNQDRLVVNLSRKTIGRIALIVQLRKPLVDPNLRSPTGQASVVSFAIPKAESTFRNQYSGRIVLYAPESLRLTPATTTGMRTISFNEAMTPIPSHRQGKFESTRSTLAYAFMDQPTELNARVERRSPNVTARQMIVARVESGVIKFETTLFYEILYSGVKSLRIDVPSEFAANIRNVSGSIRDSVMEPVPDDVAEGFVAWTLSGESEMIGTQRVDLRWETKLAELNVGDSVQAPVPRLVPRNIDREWGQIILTKSETLDVTAADRREGLRSIDPVHDVMPEARFPDAAAAMEFHDNWSLDLQITRYQLEQMKRTSIERAYVRSVVTRSNHLSVQAIYRVRTVRQRLTIQLPAEVEFDSQPARLNGTPISLERGEQEFLFVPVVGQDPNSEFILELRYTVPGDHREIRLPVFPDDPAIQKVYSAVFLPEELALLNTSGPWTEEFQWNQDKKFRWQPIPNLSDDQVVAWVYEGITVAPSPGFQKDGTMHLFSALRPAAPPDGNLHLMATSRTVLGLLIVATLAAMGVLLLRSPITYKLVAIVMLLIVAVLCGVFMPTLGQQLLGLPTYVGLTIVVLVWVAHGLLRMRKHSVSRRKASINVSQESASPEKDNPETELPSNRDGGNEE